MTASWKKNEFSAQIFRRAFFLSLQETKRLTGSFGGEDNRRPAVSTGRPVTGKFFGVTGHIKKTKSKTKQAPKQCDQKICQHKICGNKKNMLRKIPAKPSNMHSKYAENMRSHLVFFIHVCLHFGGNPERHFHEWEKTSSLFVAIRDFGFPNFVLTPGYWRLFVAQICGNLCLIFSEVASEMEEMLTLVH